MNFVSVRLITDNPERLVAFYEQVTGLRAVWATPEFAEIATPSATFAFSHVRAIDRFQPGTGARPAANASVILELRVADVDADFRRLGALIGTPVQAPMTMPWGNRSLLFRDPDGNLVNLFTPVTPEARAKLDARP